MLATNRLTRLAAGLAFTFFAADASADAANVPEAGLSTRLARALTSRRVPEDLRIEVGWRETDLYRDLTLWGDGVGIWNRRRQFRLGEEDLLRILGLFAEADIDAIPSQGPDDEAEGDEEGGGDMRQTMRVRWKVSLEIGPESRTVVRTTRQPRVAPLERLGAGIVALCEPASRKGLEAADLADALKKLQAGRLAPQTLSVRFTKIDEKADPSGARPGWRLGVRGHSFELTIFEPGTGSTLPRPGRLSPPELRDLVKWLRKAEVESFPAVLFSGRYEQLSIDALGHEKDLQARTFAGLDRGKTRKAQAAYEKLRGRLEGLEKVLAARTGAAASP